MTAKRLSGLFVLLLFSLVSHAWQVHSPYVGTYEEAKTKGITTHYLDSLYRDAVNTDTSKAVFKTDVQSDSLTAAYVHFLKDFGKYLKEHDFTWDQPTRCGHRLYFNNDGTLEYYLFSFKTPVDDKKQERFKSLFTSYAQSHKLGIQANVRFAQCNSVTFMDK